MSFFSFLKPSPRITINASQLTDIIANAMEAANIELHLCGTLLLADKTYNLITDNEAFTAVRDSQTFYIAGLSDCDDTAWKAKARVIDRQGMGHFGSNPACFGVIWTLTHAFNIYVNDKRQLLMIDNDCTVHPPSWVNGPVKLVVI